MYDILYESLALALFNLSIFTGISYCPAMALCRLNYLRRKSGLDPL
jgi:hypothetical protein